MMPQQKLNALLAGILMGNWKSRDTLWYYFASDLRTRIVNPQKEAQKKECFKYLSKEAEDNNFSAIAALGALYEVGTGVKANLVEALRLYRLASEAQNPWGQHYLGICYYNGKGVAQNKKMAWELVQNAADQPADQPYPPAQFVLGLLYQNENNTNKRDECSRLAAQQGEPNALQELCYRGSSESLKHLHHPYERVKYPLLKLGNPFELYTPANRDILCIYKEIPKSGDTHTLSKSPVHATKSYTVTIEYTGHVEIDRKISEETITIDWKEKFDKSNLSIAESEAGYSFGKMFFCIVCCPCASIYHALLNDKPPYTLISTMTKNDGDAIKRAYTIAEERFAVEFEGLVASMIEKADGIITDRIMRAEAPHSAQTQATSTAQSLVQVEPVPILHGFQQQSQQRAARSENDGTEPTPPDSSLSAPLLNPMRQSASDSDLQRFRNF